MCYLFSSVTRSSTQGLTKKYKETFRLSWGVTVRIWWRDNNRLEVIPYQPLRTSATCGAKRDRGGKADGRLDDADCDTASRDRRVLAPPFPRDRRRQCLAPASLPPAPKSRERPTEEQLERPHRGHPIRTLVCQSSSVGPLMKDVGNLVFRTFARKPERSVGGCRWRSFDLFRSALALPASVSKTHCVNCVPTFKSEQLLVQSRSVGPPKTGAVLSLSYASPLCSHEIL